MGAGMKASLISEVIADSISWWRAKSLDRLVTISGCDKPIGVMMARPARYSRPRTGGGSLRPVTIRAAISIQDVFEAVGKYTSGKIDAAALKAIEDMACPGAGACGGQFTANTMSTVMEFLGISPMGSNGIPAMSPDKDSAAFSCGQLVMQLLRNDLRPSHIFTRQAFENAISSVAATGGSTNAVLLMALAHEAGVALDIDDFDRISARTPIIADLKPGGRFAAADLHRAGGIQLVALRLIEGGYLHRAAITVTGKTIAEEASKAAETPGQEVVVTTDRPIKPTGGLLILKGNLSPEGCPVKMSGHNRVYHRGPARVFDEAAFQRYRTRSDRTTSL
jgi:dihydroxy-acid dehydratase